MNNKAPREILIGIHGKAGTGKDLVAEYLRQNYGLFPVAFATPIKHALVYLLQDAYRLTLSHFDGPIKEVVIPGLGKSPRQLTQSMGTDWGRDQVNPEVWMRIAAATIRDRRALATSIELPFPGVVVTDVRFKDEAQWIRSNGGAVLHLYRAEAKQVNQHVSEDGGSVGPDDLIINNNGTIKELQAKLSSVMSDIIASRMEVING